MAGRWHLSKSMMRASGRGPARWAVLVLGIVLSTAVAAPAQASVTVHSFSITPSTTLAGAHPDVTIATSFSYSDSTDDVQSLQVYFPAGLLGNPTVTTRCSSAQLAADACPASSKIGTVSVTATAAGIPLPVTAPGDVYNVTPTGSEPARIGMVVRPTGGILGKLALSGPVSIRIPGDEGLVSTFTNLPRTLPPALGIVPVPITIQSISLTLFGLVNGGSAAFMTNPTSCGPAYGVGIATSYESSAPSALFGGFTPTDCAHVPFNPGLGFSFGSPNAGTPSSVNVSVTVPAAELPRRQSHVNASVVFLPVGTAINFAALGSIATCSDAQLAINSAAPASCPAGSQIGTATFSTPLLGTVPGQVFFATGTPANPLRLFVQLDIGGLYTKLIAVNSFYGPFIVSTLSNLPQVPFTNFTLSFSGGPNALLEAPTCGTDLGLAVFVPWSGNPYQVVENSVTISKTSTGAACPAIAGSAPATRGAVAHATAMAASLARTRHVTQADRLMKRLIARARARAGLANSGTATAQSRVHRCGYVRASVPYSHHGSHDRWRIYVKGTASCGSARQALNAVMHLRATQHVGSSSANSYFTYHGWKCDFGQMGSQDCWRPAHRPYQAGALALDCDTASGCPGNVPASELP